MRFEKLNHSNGKKMFLYGFIVCAILMIIISLFISKAKYRVTQSVNIVNGTVNYKLADLNVVAVYTKDNDEEEYKITDDVPKSGYVLNKGVSYCTIPGNEDKNYSMLEFDAGKLIVDITKKGTKCYLYFEKSKLLKDEVIAQNIGEIGDITGPSCIQTDPNCGSQVTNMKQNGVFETEDDDGKSYYFRGTVDNNWVKFGKTNNSDDIWWRIIRINGNGSIRLIYAGEGDTPTSNGSNIPNGDSIQYNAQYSDNTYVGYYYGAIRQNSHELTHTNEHRSTIAQAVENWFEKTTLNDVNRSKIDDNTGFCNDKKTQAGIWAEHGDRGYGTNGTGYQPAGRLIGSNSFKKIQTPTLKCSGAGATKNNFEKDDDYKRDYYTVETAERGNQALNYPVGLITSDEVVYAGGFGGQNNTKYWLWMAKDYWTMSPCYFNGSYAGVLNVDSGTLGSNYVNNNTFGVRPVINLKSTVEFTTNPDSEELPGTINNPYIVN